MKAFTVKLAAVAIAFALIGLSARPQADANRGWTDKHFAAAFDELFPITHGEGDFIAVRAHQDGENNALEFSLVLENTQDARAIRASLREAQGQPLYQQLLALHTKDASRTYQEMKPDLKMREWTFSAEQCPAIAAQFKAFNNIVFVRPRDEDEVPEHPILYQFHESVGGSDSEVVEFLESRGFPRWANETHKALDSCAASAQPTGTK
ncbi:MAG TPA: hypothetical protein VN822_08465 [Candidatus Acidoferrales bacterium]|nr:hypothetical protein [Candidatus Acidoferrales bacterium]